MTQKFSGMRRCRLAIEVGTHSPWLSRVLTRLGFEVIVANARRVQLIQRQLAQERPHGRAPAGASGASRSAVVAAHPASSEQAQAELMTIRIRAALVEARTSLVNSARGFAKALGERLRPATPIRWAWRSWKRCRPRCAKDCGRCWSKWKLDGPDQEVRKRPSSRSPGRSIR